MEQNFGKLILTQEAGSEREFGLSKTTITLGRALTNDIVLGDARVSRTHAQIACGPSGCRIIDLGSANGIRLNGVTVPEGELKAGDTISLGNTRLRFETSELADDMEMTRIDSPSDLDLTMDREVLPMSINETHTPVLVVFTEEKTWEVPLEDLDAVTIGRTAENRVVIDQPKVSRRHAEMVRKGNAWILRDLGSTNGTRFKGQRITEIPLQDGDSFHIGPVQLVFKGGIGDAEMTRIDETFARIPTRRPVIFVPGLLGSELWLGNERVWPSVKNMFTKPELFLYPSSAPLEPRGILEEIVIVPNFIKQDQYNRLGDYLVEELGYERGKDYFDFPYDWRQDVRISARQLGEFIDTLPRSQPVTLIAHSLGTLVSRYYIEKLGGRHRVERAMLMGGPHRGVVKALSFLLLQPSVLPFGLMGERLRRLMASWPTSYQILPTYACGTDQNGQKIDFMVDESWVAEEHLPLLRAGREFRRELGYRSSVPAISIFGYGIKTISSVTVNRKPSGELAHITFQTEPTGDSGILEKSAVLPGSEIHPVQQYHGSLFVDNDVKRRLKLELARQWLS